MNIIELRPESAWKLFIRTEDGRAGHFDVTPYLDCEAFENLRDCAQFEKVFNGGYFVEWDCGADLSSDTIEAKWQLIETAV